MNQNVIIAGVSVFSTAVGAVAGYYYAKKRLTDEFGELANAEIEAAKDFYGAMYKTGENSTPAKAAAARGLSTVVQDDKAVKAGEALATYQGQTVAVVAPDKGLQEIAEEIKEDDVPNKIDHEEPSEAEIAASEPTTSIFVEGRPMNPSDFDLEAERDERVNGKPYVVSQEEFDANEFKHEQTILTYFAYDSTLCDEDEKQIDDVENTVGVANLLRFGHGSNDAKVVYIRNEAREIDFEVLHSDGSYAEEVLGLTEETALEHSDMPRRHRRSFDE